MRIFARAEIERRGLAAVMADALDIVRAAPAGFGISIDLDALDPREAPGVGTPAPSGLRATAGLRAAALAAALAGSALDAQLIAIEIAEYNPHRDTAGATAAATDELLAAMLDPAPGTAALIDLDRRYGARNYAPLPIVLTRGRGVQVWDAEGRRYLDFLSAYSAVSIGHAHPRVLRALSEQARALAVPSRAFLNDRLPHLLERLCTLTGFDQALTANTGLEAVETALKAARKWAYSVKGVAPDAAEIIACVGNFHGRSIAIVAMSSDPQYRDGFGPFPPGFKRIPFGDADALERAITPHTAAFLV